MPDQEEKVIRPLEESQAIVKLVYPDALDNGWYAEGKPGEKWNVYPDSEFNTRLVQGYDTQAEAWDAAATGAEQYMASAKMLYEKAFKIAKARAADLKDTQKKLAKAVEEWDRGSVIQAKSEVAEIYSSLDRLWIDLISYDELFEKMAAAGREVPPNRGVPVA